MCNLADEANLEFAKSQVWGIYKEEITDQMIEKSDCETALQKGNNHCFCGLHEDGQLKLFIFNDFYFKDYENTSFAFVITYDIRTARRMIINKILENYKDNPNYNTYGRVGDAIEWGDCEVQYLKEIVKICYLETRKGQ